MVTFVLPPKILLLFVFQGIQKLNQKLLLFDPMDSFYGGFYGDNEKIRLFIPRLFLSVPVPALVQALTRLSNIEHFIGRTLYRNVNCVKRCTSYTCASKCVPTVTGPSSFRVQYWTNFAPVVSTFYWRWVPMRAYFHDHRGS